MHHLIGVIRAVSTRLVEYKCQATAKWSRTGASRHTCQIFCQDSRLWSASVIALTCTAISKPQNADFWDFTSYFGKIPCFMVFSASLLLQIEMKI